MTNETELNIDLAPRVYLVASELAKAQERAIEAAIDHYFGSPSWDEEELTEKACTTHHANGSEVFSIGDHDLVEFSNITSKIEIDRNCANLRFTMEITELYK